MRLRLIYLLLVIMVCGLNTGRQEVCPPPPLCELTKPLNTRDNCKENNFLRYQCVDGYVRMAGTSNRIGCIRVHQELQWTTPILKCIPDPSIPTTIEQSTTHKTNPSPTTHHSVPTERVSPPPTTTNSLLYRTLHPVTETQEVITTVTVTTTIDDITSVPVDKSSAVTSVSTMTVSPDSYCVSNIAPTSSEDPGGSNEKSSATAIYAVTILPVAAFGVLMFWRWKWTQQVDLLPTPAEMVQMNVAT